jgi:fructokinase
MLFERNAGGAPANVLAAVSKLGCTGAFIGKVGNDSFGRFLAQVLDENKIETRGLKFSNDVNTTLAFVHLDEKGIEASAFIGNQVPT